MPHPQILLQYEDVMHRFYSVRMIHRERKQFSGRIGLDPIATQKPQPERLQSLGDLVNDADRSVIGTGEMVGLGD